jgi:hypothetical protein
MNIQGYTPAMTAPVQAQSAHANAATGSTGSSLPNIVCEGLPAIDGLPSCASSETPEALPPIRNSRPSTLTSATNLLSPNDTVSATRRRLVADSAYLACIHDHARDKLLILRCFGWLAFRCETKLLCQRRTRCTMGSFAHWLSTARNEPIEVSGCAASEVTRLREAGAVGAFDSSSSYLIRDAHREAIADDFKFGPADQQLIHSQRHIAGVVAGSLHDRPVRERQQVADGKPHHRQVEAEGARQPRHAVEQIFSGRRRHRCGCRSRDSLIGWIWFRILDCSAHGPSRA